MEKETFTNYSELNEQINIVNIIEQLQNKIEVLEIRLDKLLEIVFSEIAS